MKKRVLIIILSIALTMCFSTTAMASGIENSVVEKNVSANVVYSTPEITNTSLLYSRAVAGINEDPSRAPLHAILKVTDLNDNSVTIFESDETAQFLETTQLLQTMQKSNGLSENSYVRSIIVPMADYVKTDSKALQGVTTTIKLYYSTGTMENGGQNVDFIKMSQMVGSWTSTGPMVSAKKAMARYNGFNLSTSTFQNEYVGWVTTSADSVTVTTPNCGPLEINSGLMGRIAGQTSCIVTKTQNERWLLEFESYEGTSNPWW